MSDVSQGREVLDPLGLPGLNDHVVAEERRLSWMLTTLDGE